MARSGFQQREYRSTPFFFAKTNGSKNNLESAGGSPTSMLTLNLLPEQYKREYALEIKTRFAVFVFISLAVILAVFIVLLFSAYFYLRIQVNSMEESLVSQRTAANAKPMLSLEKDIKALNAKIGITAKARSDIFPVAPALEKIALLIKQGAYLKSVSLDNKTGAVTIAGFASTRDLVLDLKSDLVSSEFVKPDSIQDPIQNILKDKKIDFTFTFQLEPIPII